MNSAPLHAGYTSAMEAPSRRPRSMAAPRVLELTSGQLAELKLPDTDDLLIEQDRSRRVALEEQRRHGFPLGLGPRLREELEQREMLGVIRERRKGFGTVLELVGEQVLAELLGGHVRTKLRRGWGRRAGRGLRRRCWRFPVQPPWSRRGRARRGGRARTGRTYLPRLPTYRPAPVCP